MDEVHPLKDNQGLEYDVEEMDEEEDPDYRLETIIDTPNNAMTTPG